MREHPTLDEYMRAKLKDPAEARGYFEVALKEYARDGDEKAPGIAMLRVAEAQGPGHKGNESPH